MRRWKNNSRNTFVLTVFQNGVYLGKPKKVVGDGGGAALDLHQWDLIFSRHQDVFLVVEHSSQVHAPETINAKTDPMKVGNFRPRCHHRRL